MKHLLRSGNNFINAFVLTDYARITICYESGWAICLPFSTGQTKLDIHYRDIEEAQKECDRINKWLENFIDYEAEGTTN